MSSRLPRAATASVALILALALPAFAHSGEEASAVSVEPAEVTAGDTVVLAGTGLEPDSDRQINLVGPDVIVPYEAVKTDADGMFSVTLTIPAHLPAGTYTFQVIGDETLTTECRIRAAAGQEQVEPKNEAGAVVTPRARPGSELAIIAVFVLVAFGIGMLLVGRAERFGRAAQP